MIDAFPDANDTHDEIGGAGRIALVEALGDTPETVIATHLLRHGLARAYASGPPSRFKAAVIENLAFGTDELTAFGTDPALIWEIVRKLEGWSCVLVDAALAASLGELLRDATGRSPRTLEDVYHVQRHPLPPIPLAPVRLLTPADAPLLARAPRELRGAGYPSTAALLRDGAAAAAIIDGEIVALAHAPARSANYADLGVTTLPTWRGRGLASAAASLVAARVQAAGQTPVWSTGATTTASLQVAAKLGFVEVRRRTYVIQ